MPETRGSPRDQFVADGRLQFVEDTNANRITLAHNVPTRAEVDAVLATARAAGADPVTDALEREWGGYTGYFGDPDGYRWEVAVNPGPIGQVVLP